MVVVLWETGLQHQMTAVAQADYSFVVQRFKIKIYISRLGKKKTLFNWKESDK